MFAILTKYIGTNTSLNRYILWGEMEQTLKIAKADMVEEVTE